MPKIKEPKYSDPVEDFEKVELSIDDFILAMRDRKGFIKRDSKARALRYFWCVDDEDWFYDSGHSNGVKKPIEVEGMLIRKDLKQFLEFRKEEGWLFYLEIQKNE
jgi:hypothetical protein